MAHSAGYGGVDQAKYPDGESKQSGHTINFTDYDDDSSSYYMGKRALSHSASGQQFARKLPSQTPNSLYAALAYGLRSRHDGGLSQADNMSPDEQESLLSADESPANNHRVKRQVYESSYENEPPCYGFPLEVNVRSRIKFDQVFPIRGNSQFKKCIKVG